MRLWFTNHIDLLVLYPLLPCPLCSSFVLSSLLPCPLFFRPLLSSSDITTADTVVNMRKVTHQTISEELSKTVLLPCLFTLHPGAGSSHEPPRIKWTKVWGQRGSDGLQKEQSVLVAKDNVVKVQIVFSLLPPSSCSSTQQLSYLKKSFSFSF